jgi:hypothetical protein
MTVTYELTEATHDLTVVGGKIKQVNGANEVRQRVLIALKHLWNEYFLNIPTGVPWDELILGSKDKKLVEAIFRQVLLDVPGVHSIYYLKITLSGRSATLDATLEVVGIYGVESTTISLTKGG